jgi:hypothetical protein
MPDTRTQQFIYGRWENFETQTLPELDACNGHFGFTPDNPTVAVYHYHVTSEAPFTLGCIGPATGNQMVTVAQCRAVYSSCGDGDTSIFSVEMPQGNPTTITYDLNCPCFDGAENNDQNSVLLPYQTTSTPPSGAIFTPATQSMKICSQLGWNQVNELAPCANSAFPSGFESVGITKECYKGRQMQGAAKLCEAIGARLCSHSEAIDAIAAGTGCDLDYRWHWTSTACGTAGDGTEKYYLVKTKKAGKSKAKCKKITKVKAVRCCADAQQ